VFVSTANLGSTGNYPINSTSKGQHSEGGKKRRSPRNYEMYMSLVKETEQMVIEAKRMWWEAEISRLEVAS